MRAVLANLGQLKIRGGFLLSCFGDQDAGGLDNVRLDLSDAPPAPLPGPKVVSDFEIDAEGWAVAGNGFGRSGALEWRTDATAGGHLAAAANGEWYWLAPAKFHGNALSAYGKTLDFELRHDVPNGDLNCLDLPAVILDGGGYCIYTVGDRKPGPNWSSFSVVLHDTAKWYHSGTTQRVNAQEMQAVLSNLGQIKIRGGFLGRPCFGDENNGGLNQVVLNLQ